MDELTLKLQELLGIKPVEVIPSGEKKGVIKPGTCKDGEIVYAFMQASCRAAEALYDGAKQENGYAYFWDKETCEAVGRRQVVERFARTLDGIIPEYNGKRSSQIARNSDGKIISESFYNTWHHVLNFPEGDDCAKAIEILKEKKFPDGQSYLDAFFYKK